MSLYYNFIISFHSIFFTEAYIIYRIAIKQLMQRPGADKLQNYQLIVFEQGNALMRRKSDRKIFKYYQQSIPDASNITELKIPEIITPIKIDTGFLFEKGITLAQKIQKNSIKHTFSEEQLINTLSSILSILKKLHNQGYNHGCISPQTIFVDSLGQLKLYYPGLDRWGLPYYQNRTGDKKLKYDDYKAVALICLYMLGCSIELQKIDIKQTINTLKSQKKIGDRLAITLYILFQKKMQYFSKLDGVLQSDQPFSPQIQQLYQKQILRKYKVKTENNLAVNKHCYYPGEFTPPLNRHNQSPKKIVQVTKKLSKIQDSQNKKGFEDNRRKKTYETALKKMSNGKTLVEGQNYTNHANNSPTYKKILRDIRETKEREDFYRLGMTIKQRMRTMSKKKL